MKKLILFILLSFYLTNVLAEINCKIIPDSSGYVLDSNCLESINSSADDNILSKKENEIINQAKPIIQQTINKHIDESITIPIKNKLLAEIEQRGALGILSAHTGQRQVIFQLDESCSNSDSNVELSKFVGSVMEPYGAKTSLNSDNPLLIAQLKPQSGLEINKIDGILITIKPKNSIGSNESLGIYWDDKEHEIKNLNDYNHNYFKITLSATNTPIVHITCGKLS